MANDVQATSTYDSPIIQVDNFKWQTTSIRQGKSRHVAAKFQTFIFLEGEQSFWLDEKFFHIDAGHGDNCRPKALTVAMNRETEIRLLRGENSPLNKVSISTPVDWLDLMSVEQASRDSNLTDFLSGHLNHLVWDINPEVAALCDQIVAPPHWLDGGMQHLYRSARGLDMMIAVCQRVSGHGQHLAERASHTTRTHMNRVRDYLMDHIDEDMTIDRIARDTGTSIRSLQRKFRDQFGESVFEFVRHARLDRAREALIRDHVSVAEAAHLAGYNTTASFSAAFKRHFGKTPSKAS